MLRDEFLRHRQLVGGQAIERQQQPAAQLLIHRVMPVADRGLGHLRDQCLRVTQQQQQHLPVAVELLLELAGRSDDRHDRRFARSRGWAWFRHP